MRPRRLSDQQIEDMCRTLLSSRRRVSVRDVRSQLRSAFGAVGRSNRITTILSRVAAEPPPPANLAPTEELAALLEKLRVAEERALRAEQREIDHQDLWAARYAQKLEELGRVHSKQLSAATQSASERYLRVYQWASLLAERLSRYEKVEPLGVQGKGGTGA